MEAMKFEDIKPGWWWVRVREKDIKDLIPVWVSENNLDRYAEVYGYKFIAPVMGPEAYDVLKDMEFCQFDSYDGDCCPNCHSPEGKDHLDNCKLAKLLKDKS